MDSGADVEIGSASCGAATLDGLEEAAGEGIRRGFRGSNWPLRGELEAREAERV